MLVIKLKGFLEAKPLFSSSLNFLVIDPFHYQITFFRKVQAALFTRLTRI